MAIGTQYISPGGWSTMAKDVLHHRLGHTENKDRVVFVVFQQKARAASIVVMSSEDFEDGLASGAVAAAPTQITMPPWLAELQGMNLGRIDQLPRRLSLGKRTHQSLVSQRLMLISDAVAHATSILSADDPERAANGYARSAQPPQNETRFRAWLWVYLVFGEDMWTLMPPMQHNGKWDREERPSKVKKLGRPSKHFGHRGWFPRTASMDEKSIEGYLRFARLGWSMIKIYSRSMRKVFECKPCKDSKGQDHWKHDKGEPFPSREQFIYACEKRFGQSAIKETLYGEVRTRSKHAAVVGRFSQGLANLMEKASTDASYSKEFPRGFGGTYNMPRLCIAKIVCQVSGAIVGIGFGLTSETARAYRMALFCCAIDKARWGRIFGMVITEADIPGAGLPPNFASDRGAFGSRAVADPLREMHAGRESSPSYTPQSNSTVESKNTRAMKASGEPTFIKTDMNPVQLARRLINDCIESNRGGSAVDRMTPEMVEKMDRATPIAIWEFLDVRGRNDAKTMPFEEAVRQFLTRVKLRSRKGKLWLGEICFNSEALMATDLPRKIRGHDGIEVDGYVVDLAIRYAWIEVAGQLIEVEAQQPIRDDDETLFLSLNEIGVHIEKTRALRAIQVDGRASVKGAADEKSEREIGSVASSEKRLKGRPKSKTPAARDDARRADRVNV